MPGLFCLTSRLCIRTSVCDSYLQQLLLFITTETCMLTYVVVPCGAMHSIYLCMCQFNDTPTALPLDVIAVVLLDLFAYINLA